MKIFLMIVIGVIILIIIMFIRDFLSFKTGIKQTFEKYLRHFKQENDFNQYQLEKELLKQLNNIKSNNEEQFQQFKNIALLNNQSILKLSDESISQREIKNKSADKENVSNCKKSSVYYLSNSNDSPNELQEQFIETIGRKNDSSSANSPNSNREEHIELVKSESSSTISIDLTKMN